MCFVLVLVVVLVLESGLVECCANSELHPRIGLGNLKKILGSGTCRAVALRRRI